MEPSLPGGSGSRHFRFSPRKIQALGHRIQVRVEDVSVRGQGERGAAVAENPLDSCWRSSTSDQRGRGGVTEDMDPDIRKVRDPSTWTSTRCA